MLARSSLLMACVILVLLLGLEAEHLRGFPDIDEDSDVNKGQGDFFPEKRNKESLEKRLHRRFQYERRFRSRKGCKDRFLPLCG